MKILKGFSLVLMLSYLFVSSYGDPLDSNQETAFDHIDQANRDLPEALKNSIEEGDIIIPPPDAALDKNFRQWPKGVVPFTVSSSFSNNEKSSIRSALRNIMDAVPCLNFQEYTLGSSGVPRAHVEVIKSSGCWSLVGRTGGKQSLSLGRGCVFTGTIIHEFLHAIGFYHEQSRPDRDQHVIINTRNIKAGREHNFRIASRVNSLGVEYDPKSVMHYSNNAFSNGNGPTIEWRANRSLRLGGRVLSPKDILQLNLKYCGTSTTKKPRTSTTTRSTTTTTTRSTTSSTSSPTPRTTTTRRPSKVCGDKKGACITVQFRKRPCTLKQRRNCPRSCGVCTGPEWQTCLNFRDNTYGCFRKAHAGYCQHPLRRIRWKTKVGCSRTCCERGELYKRPGRN